MDKKDDKITRNKDNVYIGKPPMPILFPNPGSPCIISTFNIPKRDS